MADKLSIDQRHYNMSRIRAKNTKSEMIVRKYLWSHGFRYRLNHPRLPGKPDIVLRKYRTCIFSKLHPLLVKRIIALFNDANTNPHGAQLLFTAHDTHLLSAELFRRDQVWFTQKDNLGATELYSLAEYKVRSSIIKGSDPLMIP